jgi:hypothetical protein
MNTSTLRAICAALICLLVAGLFVAPLVEAKKKDKYLERYMARPANSNRMASIEIGISSWSTDEDRERFLGILASEGSEALVEALKESESCGFIRTEAGSHSLRYCKKFEHDGGLTIIVGTDRPLGYREVVQHARSLEYTITLLQLDKDEKGKWTGAYAPAEKLSWNEKTRSFKAESWQAKPELLVGIRELD